MSLAGDIRAFGWAEIFEATVVFENPRDPVAVAYRVIFITGIVWVISFRDRERMCMEPSDENSRTVLRVDWRQIEFIAADR